MAKSKNNKASSRAKTKRAVKPAAKAKTRAGTVKQAAKAKPAKRPASKAKAASRPKSAKAAAKTSAKPARKAVKASAKPKAKTVAKKPAVRAAAKAKPKAKPQAQSKPKPARKPQAESPSPSVAASKPKPPQIGRDWSATLFLPKTDFPMKAGLPEREPELLKRWERLRLYDRLREEAMGREKFILHDGPPYANGHLHIGHALNKILKDVINRSQGMMGKDANYVPGWDCHGLPIEWKIEEENYRAKGKTKPDLSDPAAMIAFRRECRAYAQHWLDVQRAEFKRLGVEGDWDHPYTTMSFDAEATIAAELMKFAMNGTLYRGSKPVMWSVVEKTALAEAEVEYQEVTSHTIFVKFPIEPPAGPVSVVLNGGGEGKPTPQEIASFADKVKMLEGASVVIWTTTPWTIPGNRAIAFSPDIAYGLYEVTDAPADNWAKPGDKLVLADALAENIRAAARIDAWQPHRRCRSARPDREPSLAAPSRCRRLLFISSARAARRASLPRTPAPASCTSLPATARTTSSSAPNTASKCRSPSMPTAATLPMSASSPGKRVMNDKGAEGDANGAVIAALQEVGALIARGRLRHDYPHSWRSKKPVIFRNTPQWFIAMDARASTAALRCANVLSKPSARPAGCRRKARTASAAWS